MYCMYVCSCSIVILCLPICPCYEMLVCLIPCLCKANNLFSMHILYDLNIMPLKGGSKIGWASLAERRQSHDADLGSVL